MVDVRILAVIEEIGDMSTSGAIVNFNLCKLLGKKFQKVDILTLDSITEKYKEEYRSGEIFIHPKSNLTKLQNFITKIPIKKLYPIISMFLGNDFLHYNRVKNIKKFLHKNEKNYDIILFLSAGLGFTPHHAIFNKIKGKTIGIYHDPYPISCYPGDFKSGKRWPEFFKIRNQQNSFNKIGYLVFPSQRLFEWYLNDYAVDSNKVSIIPHAVNFDKQEKFLHNDNEKIKIVHAGTLLRPRNPKTFITVFNKLKLENKVDLEFYGGVNKKILEDVNELVEGSSIVFNNYRIEYLEALKKLQGADFLLLIESDSTDNPFLPTKFVDYINLDKPIIILTPKNSEIARLLGDNYPFMCRLNDTESISDILQNKIFDKKLNDTALSKIKELQNYFSEEYILMQYIRIVNLIIKK